MLPRNLRHPTGGKGQALPVTAIRGVYHTSNAATNSCRPYLGISFTRGDACVDRVEMGSAIDNAWTNYQEEHETDYIMNCRSHIHQSCVACNGHEHRGCTPSQPQCFPLHYVPPHLRNMSNARLRPSSASNGLPLEELAVPLPDEAALPSWIFLGMSFFVFSKMASNPCLMSSGTNQ